MLQGERVTLKPFAEHYLERSRQWVNDAEIAGLLDRVLPVTVEEQALFYRRAIVENRSAVWFAVFQREEHIGNCWLWDIKTRHRNAELRIVIGERSAWGTGAGTEAIALLTDYAHQSLGLHKVYAYVMQRNPRARAAFQKSGYALEADLRDEVFWNGRFEGVWRLTHVDA